MFTYVYQSPVGPLTIKGDDSCISRLDFVDGIPSKGEPPVSIKKTIEQLDKYFKGELKEFSVPINFDGTPFQKKVWEALLTIPYGETRSYKDIAIQVGNEKCCRAAGNAIGRNPIAIIIPCHRVIGTDGGLHGFGGPRCFVDKKRSLLELEKNNINKK